LDIRQYQSVQDRRLDDFRSKLVDVSESNKGTRDKMHKFAQDFNQFKQQYNSIDMEAYAHKTDLKQLESAQKRTLQELSDSIAGV